MAKLSKAEQVRFDQFWTAYPRKVGKAAAVRRWQTLKPDDTLVATMLTALTWQVRQDAWTKDGGEFIPHPATWLHAGRWDDEPVKPKPKRGQAPTTVRDETWRQSCQHDPPCDDSYRHRVRMDAGWTEGRFQPGRRP